MPFIKSFSKLHTLTLSTEDDYHRPSEMYMPTWPKLLPPTLKSLSLDYRGALDVFTTLCPFYHLQSLSYLSIHQEIPLENEHYTSLVLRGLPPSLRHLILHSEMPDYSYLTDDIESLPDLITFDVNLQGVSLPSLTSKKTFCFGSAAHPSSLTHLGISFGDAAALEISNCASNLLYLRAPAERVYFHGKHCSRLTSAEGAPIRSILPSLHTLILINAPTLPWELIETLPLSLTRLGASFDLDPAHMSAIATTCSNMNESYSNTFGSDRSGAPMMIRRLDIPDLTIEAQDQLMQLLPHFPALEVFHLPQATNSLWTHQLGARTTSVEVEQLSGPLALMPRSLQRITCSLMTIDLTVGQQPNQPPPSFAQLSSLVITQSSVNKELISLLPTSLIHLQLVISSQDSMEALAIRTKELPSLTSLTLRVSENPSNDLGSTVQVDLHHIPSTLKLLELRGAYSLPQPPSTASLAHHPNLTALRLRTACSPLVALSQLPKQLRRISIALSAPVDLNDPAELELLMNLPKTLRKVHIHTVAPRPGLSPTTWFSTVNPTSLRSISLESLSQSNMRRFNLLRALPSWLVSQSMLYLISESFVVSCLPRTVNWFEAPYASNRSLYALQRRITAPQSLFELSTNWHIVSLFQRLVQYRLPLIGLLMPNTYSLDVKREDHNPRFEAFDEERLRALPPNLSVFDPHLVDLSDVWQRKDARRRAQVDLKSKPLLQNRFTFRALYHGMNLAIWLHLSWMFAFKRGSTLSTFRWINIIGSALALPLQFVVHHPVLRGYLPPGNNWAHTLVGASLVGIVFVFPVFTGMWLSSYSNVSSQLRPPSDPWDSSRWLAPVLFAIGEIVTNAAIITYADRL